MTVSHEPVPAMREPEGRVAMLEARLRRCETRIDQFDDRAEEPPWGKTTRWVMGGLAVVFVLGLAILMVKSANDIRGVRFWAATLGAGGTLTQAFLAADRGPVRRTKEDLDPYRKRMKRRDGFDVAAWAAITVSVLTVAVVELLAD